ncbi:Plant Iojap-like protein [Actinobacillus pleuropneumoniae serovar 13 str. N273]|nr:ribosome silencing factor [Actinobacillus pleuropneumoniae]EFN02105.1 Plant Iojap-like protein [Actinobacillus pleuropneumoniae serovar 13 str. N273]
MLYCNEFVLKFNVCIFSKFEREPNVEQNLVEFLTKTLDDLKAQDILAIDVRGKSSITDTMIIATGTSVRHVASTADRLSAEAKQAGFEVFGEEGKAVADWIVVDFGQAIVHLLQADAREMYQLEKLWA